MKRFDPSFSLIALQAKMEERGLDADPDAAEARVSSEEKLAIVIGMIGLGDMLTMKGERTMTTAEIMDEIALVVATLIQQQDEEAITKTLMAINDLMEVGSIMSKHIIGTIIREGAS